MTLSRWLALLILPAIVIAFYALGLQHALSLENAKAQQATLLAFRDLHPLLTVTLFALAYGVIGVIPLPLAALMALLGGALFGLVGGFTLVALCAPVGACTGFLGSRYLLRDAIQTRYGKQVARINDGVRRDGMLFLLSVRLVPVLPFFMVNLLFGLSSMPLRTFFIGGLLGMAPGALVLANAGRQLARIQSMDDLLSRGIVLSLIAVAALPWVLKLITRVLRKRSAA